MTMNDEPRVLIVEDNDALRVLIFTILRHQSLGVDTAASAEEALEKVALCDYALILVDVDMAGDEGIRFIRAFREQRPEGTSFVMAVKDPRNDVFLDSAMVNAILAKPIEIDTMAEMVRECARVVPPPEDPLPCPPAESDASLKLDPYLAN
jgi:DNA-binding response OmpR family regulator